jgi:phage terminase small subunit
VSSVKASAKKKLFVADYLANGCNATKAAIAAGYSERTAYSQGQRMLKNVEVAKMIAAGIERAVQKAEISQDELVAELRALAFAPVDLNLVDASDVLRAKSKALVDLAKLLGYWKERTELDVGPTLLELIESSYPKTITGTVVRHEEEEG